MVKGSQRRIILLRETGSQMFEEAYFILKPEKAHLPEQLMIAEANRIIEENALRRSRRQPAQSRHRRERWSFFLCGLASGFIFLGTLWLFLG